MEKDEERCSDCGDLFTEADTQTRKTGRCWQCACNDHAADVCWDSPETRYD